MYIRTHAYIYIYIHRHNNRVHTHGCEYTYTHGCKYTHTYTHTHTHMDVCVDIPECEYRKNPYKKNKTRKIPAYEQLSVALSYGKYYLYRQILFTANIMYGKYHGEKHRLTNRGRLQVKRG